MVVQWGNSDSKRTNQFKGFSQEERYKGMVENINFYFKIVIRANLSPSPKIQSIFLSYTIGVPTLHSPRASVLREQEDSLATPE